MNNKLINRINATNAKNFVYNTACLSATAGTDYTDVYQQLLHFAEETAKEEGSVEFFFVPSNPEKGEFMLWEVWTNQAALDTHMTMNYTKDILGKNIITLKWNHLVTEF
ncbi:putative quinol monooxygenase [Enterococcus crotali]|uniref:putative quinol monooxygenase n=1 Tax=Enterococcus crotali TaxID=1453587 RepID=UPI00046EA86A|nr:antibiotic biosynthesis monooxygenase [Enterococcus crotali]